MCAKIMNVRQSVLQLVLRFPACAFRAIKNHGGELAEWLRSGLQIRVHEFDSRTRLHLKSNT
jgi:hypothetical protein